MSYSGKTIDPKYISGDTIGREEGVLKCKHPPSSVANLHKWKGYGDGGLKVRGYFCPNCKMKSSTIWRARSSLN